MIKDKYNIGRDENSIKRRTFNDIIFSSDMEMKFFRDYLLPKQNSGEITKIIIQPKFVLQDEFEKYGKKVRPIHYVGDFEAIFKDGSRIIYDVKGLATETARLKKKLFDYRYPDKILIWITLSVKYGGWLQYEELQTLRKKDKNGKR